MALAVAVVEIVPDVSKFGTTVTTAVDDAMKDVEKQVEKTTDAIAEEFKESAKVAGRSAQDIGKSFQEVGGKITKTIGIAAAAVGAAMIGLAKTSIDAASSLNEELSKTEVVLGDAADAVIEFSKTAAQSIGQSQRAALQAAGTFAIFGKAAGLAGNDLADFSTELVTLSSDFASFFNTSPEDAVLAIGAALRGEAEPIRRYGVLLNQAAVEAEALRSGIWDGNGALTAQQKTLATYRVILAQTKDAQGDFTRTSDGLANQQRILRAEFEDTRAKIGQELLPVALQLVSIFRDSVLPVISGATEAFFNLGTGTQTAIIAAIGLAAVLGPLVSTIGKIITGVSAMVSGFGKLQALLIASPWGAAAIALGAVATAIAAIAIKAANGRAAVKRLADEITKIGTKGAAQKQVSTLVDNFDDLQDIILKTDLTLGDLTDALRIGGDQATGMSDRIFRLAIANGESEVSARNLANEFIRVNEQFTKAREESQRTALVFREFDRAQIGTTEYLEQLDAAFQEADASARNLSASAARAAGDALRANAEMSASLQDVAEQQRIAAEEAEAWTQAFNDAYQNGADSFRKFDEDALSSTKNFKKTLKDQTDALIAWNEDIATIVTISGSEAFGKFFFDLGMDANKLVAELADDPEEIREAYELWRQNQEVTKNGLMGQISELREHYIKEISAIIGGFNMLDAAIRVMGGIGRGFTPRQAAAISQSAYIPGMSDDYYPGMANGGIVSGPTLSWVGEAGAEAVIPITRPQRALSLLEESGLADLVRTNSSTQNIEVVVTSPTPMRTAQDVVREFQALQYRLGAQ